MIKAIEDRVIEFFGLSLFLMLVFSISTHSVLAQAQSDEWRFKFAPYFMGASMSGTTTVRGRESTVDVSAGDIFSNLKFGFMGYLEAKKGPWGFGSDTVYMSLGTFTEVPPVNVNVKQLAWTFWGIREVNPWADFVFGARWNRINGELDFKNLDLQVGDTKNWVDPVVGMRLSTDKSKRFHAGLLADIGGFGMGSDFAWEVFPTIGVNFGRHATFAFGYRWLDMDYKTGKGNEQFAYDVLTQGPAIGLSLNF
jgi:hypothetical protein